MSRMLVWSTRWELLNSWASPQVPIPKCANHQRLIAFAFGVCKFAHKFLPHICKEIMKVLRVSNVKLNSQCEHKGHFYTNITKYFTFTLINIFDVYASFELKWRLLIGVNTLTWALDTTKTWPVPSLLHIFTHSNRLQIAWLMCLWVDIHVGLMLISILTLDEWVRWVNVGKKSSINHKWVDWEVKG